MTTSRTPRKLLPTTAVLALVLVGPAMSPSPSARAAGADFTVTTTPGQQGSYTINGQPNPRLTLSRGRTYTFDLAAPTHPFWVKTVAETGTDNTFDTGVTNNGFAEGTLTFVVPMNAPATLYYQCQYHEPMMGVLVIVSPVPAGTGFMRTLMVVGLVALAMVVWRARRRGDSSIRP